MTTAELIEQTQRLMTIKSTADRPEELRRAVDFVAGIVAKHKDIVIERFDSRDKPSFIAYRKGRRPEKFDILLNGHVDVVPGKPALFKPYVKDGRLYGRGALDMKGTALALTYAFCEMVNKVPYNLGLQIVSDEEIGGYDGVRMHIDEHNVRADFVVMGEYANDRNTIYNAARGLCWAEIAFEGKSAHGGHLWHGDNAVVKAGEFAGAVLKHYPKPDKETWTTTASISDLSTPNKAYNKVPDRAVLKIDFRFTQEDPVFHNRQNLEDFIASIDPTAKLINLATFEPAVNVEPLNPYVQGLSRALAKVTKQETQFLGRPAGSDGRHFATVGNDIVEFGLYGQGSHSDDEHVELSSFEEYRQALTLFLKKPIPDKLGETSDVREQLHEELLRKLVEVPTVSGDFNANNKAFNMVEEFLQERGMHVERIDVNGFRSIVATTRPGVKQPAVLLNAHMDVVPGSNEMYRLTLKDGKFFGRGVMDMKHAIAAYLGVVDSLKDELERYDFGLLITSDEEIGSNNGVKELVNMGYGAKVVIVPDGGNNWKLETFAKGVKWAKLEAAGKTAHASRPWEGESAINRLLGAIEDIRKLVPAHPKPEDSILSVGTINGGVAANQIPAAATAMIDVRPGSMEDHERLTEEITRICEEHGVKITFQSNEPPCITDPENPWVKPMVDAVTQVTGKAHGTSYDFAVTDGRIFSAEGMATIVINPECGNIHREDEWLGRDSFKQFCTVIEMYVRKMARPRSEGQKHDDYVWYATFGTGLWKEHFINAITGNKEATLRHNVGCTDKSPPLKDVLMSFPYKLFFAGNCETCGGGHAFIDYRKDEASHTISHAYLITREQFEEIASQENYWPETVALPFDKAVEDGHATIGDGTGDYNELLYSGIKEGYPIFSLTTNDPDTPKTMPNRKYTEMLCKGLSDVNQLGKKEAVDYLMAAPGIKDSYDRKQLFASFNGPKSKNGKAAKTKAKNSR